MIVVTHELAPRQKITLRNDSNAWRALSILSSTEAFERFSYASLRALLVLYLSDWLLKPHQYANAFGLATLQSLLERIYGPLSTPALALQIYGLYVGFFYFTAIPGGYIADRLIGARLTVLVGAGLMATGQFCLSTDRLFLPGLLCMTLGGGLFKPNISAQVGGLWAAGDPRGERAFAIFYVAINVGTFFAPFICGTLGERVGWHYGFLAAGVGMSLGTLIYVLGWKSLPGDRRRPIVHTVSAIRSPAERQRVLALCVIAALVPLFWIAYEQKSGAVILWTRQAVNLRVFGNRIPVSWILMLNPLFIFVLTPLLNLLWMSLRRRKVEPDSVSKMAVGYLLLTGAFVILMLAARGNDTALSPLWVVLFMLVLTTAELLVAAVGLSLFGRLAPAGIVSILLSLWFFATFLGNYGSGVIAAAGINLSRDIYFTWVSLLPAIGGMTILMCRHWLTGALDVSHDREHEG